MQIQNISLCVVLYFSIPSILRYTFPHPNVTSFTSIPGHDYTQYYLHFRDEETGSMRSNYLTKIVELVIAAGSGIPIV